MAKKEKPKNKSKPHKGLAKRKKTTAEHKANKKIKVTKAAVEKAHISWSKANATAFNYARKAQDTKDKAKKKKYQRLSDQYYKKYKAEHKRWSSLKKRLKPQKTKKKRVTKTKATDQTAMVNYMQEHSKKFTNEGNMAIFPTKNGSEGDVVFFAPVNTESESNSTNVTSYAVDKGAPRKDYARFSSKTITIDGLISDSDTGSAHDKWVRLRTWHSYHEELTFRGDIYYKHLIISQLDRQFTGYSNTMQVSITFTFVRAAEITTSNGKKKHAKRSKSSKTVAGSRSKKYTAVTIKKGDTLWGLSKRYGKSVSWLQKVNKIKNPNRILAGDPIYVNDKPHKQKSKVRVK